MNPVRLRAIREAERVGLRQFNMVHDNSFESSLEFITQLCYFFVEIIFTERKTSSFVYILYI